MAKAIVLALVYLLAQVAALLLVAGLRLIMPVYLADMSHFLALTLLLSHVLLVFYLILKGYMKPLWVKLKPCSGIKMFYSALLGLSSIYLVDFILSYLTFLPDLNEDTFDGLYGSLVGILSVVLTGPIAEELLFRGVITKHLCSRYNGIMKVALISGLIFGIFHMNPPQVVGASLSGFVLAYMYLKTGSLIPGILVHIFNNSLAAILDICYPEEVSLKDIMGADFYWSFLVVSLVVFNVCFYRLLINEKR